VILAYELSHLHRGPSYSQWKHKKPLIAAFINIQFMYSLN
jgi:hypothetical protein